MFWSVMTVLSGLARTFWQLFFARMGVGVGEAALSPAAYSIIADYFPPQKLSRALSVYVLGTYLGMALAYVIGGAVVGALSGMPPVNVPFFGPLVGWRIAFLVVGLPGIFLTALVWTVREPQRRGALRNADDTPRSVSSGELIGYLKQHKGTYAALFVGFGMLSLLINGMTLWTPTLLIRVHGWTVGEAGSAYGLMIGIFGGTGVVAGGWFSDHLQKRGDAGACFVAGAIGAALAVIPTALMPLMPTNTLVLALMAPSLFFASIPFGLAVSAIQQITPNQMRGQVSAIYLFFSTLLGIACGPLFVALLTDHVFHNDADVGYSMAIVGGLVALIAAVMLVGSIRLYRTSLAMTEAWKRADA
jgi:MFS family permease